MTMGVIKKNKLRLHFARSPASYQMLLVEFAGIYYSTGKVAEHPKTRLDERERESCKEKELVWRAECKGPSKASREGVETSQ